MEYIRGRACLFSLWRYVDEAGTTKNGKPSISLSILGFPFVLRWEDVNPLERGFPLEEEPLGRRNRFLR